MKKIKNNPAFYIANSNFRYKWMSLCICAGVFYMKLIKLTKNQFAQVDDENFDFLNQFKWAARKGKRDSTYYAFRSGKKIGNKRPCILMHRLIMNIEDSKIQVDHIDHNGLNNQKSNLRLCTQSENRKNSVPYGKSKYLGVDIHRGRGNYVRWRAQIKVNSENIYLGVFKDEVDAAKVYDEAAKKHHGEFANLNFK